MPLRRAKLLTMTGAYLLIVLAVAISLLQHFVLTLPKPLTQTPRADGIIVATGGQERLNAGLDLLANETAPHLLLTGVGTGITKQMIAQSLALSDAQASGFDCCVSLEFDAKDTIGNALAAKRWAAAQDVRRLILVTSDYHMPRAHLEFSYQMPTRTIIAYPIMAPDLAGKSWYSDWQTFRLYMREFLKYRLRSVALFSL